MALAHEPELSLGEHGAPEWLYDYREPDISQARLSTSIALQRLAPMRRQRTGLIRSNLRDC